MTRLAGFLKSGQGVARAPERGAELARQAADLGDPEAMVLVAEALQAEQPLPNHTLDPRAVAWLEKAAEQGNSQARLVLAGTEGGPSFSAVVADARRDLAAGKPDAYFTLVIAARAKGDFDLAREASAGGCELELPHAFAFRARLASGRGRERSLEVRDDFARAAAHHDVEGLCGLAGWLLEQPELTPAERARAETLLREAEGIHPNGAAVERVRALWERRELPAWRDKLAALIRGPESDLTAWQWGDLSNHLVASMSGLPPKHQKVHRRALVAASLRALPQKSLDPRVSFQYGLLLYRGLGGKTAREAHAKAMPFFKRAAQEGHPQACHAWGVALATGDGVTANTPQAIVFLRRAGELAYYPAWEWLGELYASPSTPDLERDLSQAIECFLKAAEDPKPNPGVYGRLAIAFSEARDYPKSRRWAERAHRAGDLVGAAILGQYLIAGTAGPQDSASGLALMKSLVDEEEIAPSHLSTAITACAFLSARYRSGKGLTQDLKRADDYLKRQQDLSDLLTKLKARR